MKRFHFPLERVRDWREKQVAIEEAQLDRLMADIRDVEGRIAALARERETNDRAVLAGSSVSASELAFLDEFRRHAKRRAVSLEQEKSAGEQRVSNQRVRVLEAQRKVRLLDKLRERKRRDWDRALDKELEEQAAEGFASRWRLADQSMT